MATEPEPFYRNEFTKRIEWSDWEGDLGHWWKDANIPGVDMVLKIVGIFGG